MPFGINADYVLIGGVLGVLLGVVFMLVFSFRRIRYLLKKIQGKPKTVPRPRAGLSRFFLILFWTALFGVLFFAGFFFQAYHSFTREEPVARVAVESGTNQVTLTLLGPGEASEPRRYRLLGEQWVLEGDILKWDNWLNFLGLHTRYRLTRLRGRYLRAGDETTRPSTVYSLVKRENHPLWGRLYRTGSRLPFVSTVYGNAVFQFSDKPRSYLVFVGTSGFVVREDPDGGNRKPGSNWGRTDS